VYHGRAVQPGTAMTAHGDEVRYHAGAGNSEEARAMINKKIKRALLLAAAMSINVNNAIVPPPAQAGASLGVLGQVDWFIQSRAYYPQYLDIVLKEYEKEFENSDRTNYNTALYGGAYGQRFLYLRY
jgi:hypothetical protein